MIKDCLEGKIDYIITKSISRFARNTLDCLQYVRQLKNLPSPVGIYFEKENIDTLDSKCELILTILSSLAQDESRSISENAKWGVQKRFQQGKAFFPTANFLGYDKDENGQLIINEQEADTVRRIYREFLQGSGTELISRAFGDSGFLPPWLPARCAPYLAPDGRRILNAGFCHTKLVNCFLLCGTISLIATA